MSSHPRMNEWGSKDVDTFWTLWKMACCPIWCSLTRRNLTLSSASTIKTTVVGVGMHPCNLTSVMVWAVVTATGRSPLVFVISGVKLNSQRYISDILEGELLPWVWEHFEGALWTFQQDSASSYGSRITQRWIQATSRRSSAKKTGPQGARTWILWTFRRGPSSRARPAELLMILSRIWKPNCSGNGP